MDCPECGHPNDVGNDFCVKCGNYLEWPDAESDRPIKSTSVGGPNSRSEADTEVVAQTTASPPSDAGHSRNPGSEAERAEQGSRSAVAPGKAKTPQKSTGDERGRVKRVGVMADISPTKLSVEVGEEAIIELRVRNKGSVVDRYSIRVQGAPAAWASIEPETLNVYPNSEADLATITFNPPRSPDTAAGKTPFKVKVISSQDPSVAATAGGILEIAPFEDLTAEISPQSSRGRRAGGHKVTVVNSGNAAVRTKLSATDPDNRLRFKLQSDEVSISPGMSSTAAIRLRARKWMWTGMPQTIPFKVLVQPEGVVPLKVDGQFVQRALIPRWLPKALFAVVPLLAALSAFLLLTANVPTVDNLQQDLALDQIRQAGFQVREVPEASETVPAGTVIRTDPEPNSRRRKGTVVKAFVSVGKNPIQLPNIVGLEGITGRSQLEALGLVVEEIQEPQEEVPLGRIFKTDPPANSKVAEGSTVKLTISSGPATPTEVTDPGPAPGQGLVEVPQCVELPVEECEAAIEQVGLKAERLEEDDENSRGTVLGTDPAGGKAVEVDSTVQIRISSGPPISTVIGSSTFAPNSTDTLSVSCPAGTRAVGGGVEATHDLNVDLTASAPVLAGNPASLYQRADGQYASPVGWIVAIRNLDAQPRLVKAVVICATSVFLRDVKIVVATSPAVAGRMNQSANAACPANSVALAGGFYPQDIESGVLKSTTPLYSGSRLFNQADGEASASDAWQATLHNRSSSTMRFKVTVICSADALRRTQSRIAALEQPLIAGSAGRIPVRCPSGTMTVGGGVDPRTVLDASNDMSVTASTAVFASGPSQGRSIGRGDGGGGPAAGWFGAVGNRSGSPQALKVAAICVEPK